MGILEDLKAFIGEKNIYFNYSEAKGDCIILWLYGGISTSSGLRPQVQIKVKNKSMSVCESVINGIYDKLSPKGNYQKTLDVNGEIMLITPKQQPFYLEKDSENRHVYVFNVDIIKRR